eukprot:scaffold5125_cov134-Isochrysis_galbana.AAC.7
MGDHRASPVKRRIDPSCPPQRARQPPALRQSSTTEFPSVAPANACQSLAHSTTPMGRWLKSVDCWVLLCEGLQSRSTTTLLAVRLRRPVVPVNPEAVLLCRQRQSMLSCGTRGTASCSPLRQSPQPRTTARRPGASNIPQQTALDPSSEG